MTNFKTMKIAQSVIYSAVLIFIGTQKLKAQMGLSFSQAQDKMMHTNKEIDINNKQIATSIFNEKATQGLYYPHFKAFGMATLMDKSLKLDANDRRDKVATQFGLSDPTILGNWDFVVQKNNFQVGGLSMTWPIYMGGKIRAANNAAKINTNIVKNDKKSSEEALVSELADRYYKAKLAEEAVKVRQQVLDGMNVHLDNADKLEKNGIIAGAEVLQAKVAVANANRELLGAKKDWQLAETALSNTLEEEESGNYTLSSPFFVKNNLKALSQYKEMASANYSQIEKLKLLEKLSEENIKAETANYLPEVAVTGQKILGSNNIPLIKNPLIVGVSASLTLFDGLSRRNKLKAAKSEKETVILAREKAELDIQTLVEKYYNELKKYEEQITSLKTSMELADELVRVRKKSFAEGIATSTDVIDAELNRSSVELQSLKAYSDYDGTLAKLFEICGISNEFSNNTL